MSPSGDQRRAAPTQNVSPCASVGRFGALGENVNHNMAHQMVSFARGVAMAKRSTYSYDAAVKIRADIGEQRKDYFLSEMGWRTVRRRADAAVLGKLSDAVRNEVVTCGWPR